MWQGAAVCGDFVLNCSSFCSRSRAPQKECMMAIPAPLTLVNLDAPGQSLTIVADSGMGACRPAGREKQMKYWLVLLLFVGWQSAESADDFYVETGLDRSLTCTQALSSKAPKATGEPELKVPKAMAPIRWPRDANGDPQFGGERQLYGYNPAFARNEEIFAADLEKKASSRVSFAFSGRPLIRDENLTLRVLLDDGRWQRIPLLAAAMTSLQRQGKTWSVVTPNPLFATGVAHESRVVFDDQCHAYTVVNAYRSSLRFAFLLHSFDGGHSWAAYPLPGWSGDGSVRMELPTSTRATLADPPVLILHQIDGGSEHKAVLLFPEKNRDGTLKRSADGFLQTVDVTVEGTMCCANHAGSESQVASRDGKVHFAYPVDYTAKHKLRNGTPEYIATFDRSTGKRIGNPSYLGLGLNGPAASPADVCKPGEPEQGCNQPNAHNQPALAIDASGYLHVVVAGHGADMWYLRSTHPNRSDSWLPAEPIGLMPDAKNYYADTYTYPSLIIDANNRPHVIARWSGEGGKYEFELVYISRDTNSRPWSVQKILLNPDRSYYTSWHHKFSIDHAGRLFVSYYYDPGNLFADEARRFANVWRFPQLCELDVTPAKCPGKIEENPPRRDFNRAEQNLEGARYGTYTGYMEVSPGLLVSFDNGATFQLATTREFFRRSR